MAKIEPFEKYTEQYEDWFVKNRFVYESELKAIREQLPKTEKGIEIGVGTGQFGAPLGIKIGIEPSRKMGKIARQRGMWVIEAIAENLPLKDSLFDFALMVTTICFLDDIEAAFKGVYRILKEKGCFIIGFVDKNSPLDELYQKRKANLPKPLLNANLPVIETKEQITQAIQQNQVGFQSYFAHHLLMQKYPQLLRLIHHPW